MSKLMTYSNTIENHYTGLRIRHVELKLRNFEVLDYYHSWERERPSDKPRKYPYCCHHYRMSFLTAISLHILLGKMIFLEGYGLQFIMSTLRCCPRWLAWASNWTVGVSRPILGTAYHIRSAITR